jgi:hypothetical protein
MQRHLRNRIGGVVTAFLLAALTGAGLTAQSASSDAKLVVHEWGTFTSIAGPEGDAIQWRPLSGPSDLPCFVRGLPGGVKYPVGATPELAPASGSAVLGALTATVRMETPVLYFYASEPARVDVAVEFPQGLITEWYPHAAVAPQFAPASVAGSYGSIGWSGVQVQPTAKPDFPTEQGPSHYYAARGTDAVPVQVNGQSEKFLFYRGLGAFQVPVTAVVDGTEVVVNSPSVTLSRAVLFENRGGRVGYRVVNDLKGRKTIDLPDLTARVEFLHWDLERMLVEQGLYPREAKAMVETWKDSWFEEGARIFYLLPQSTVDAILPLRIKPAPAQVARAFVGRLEILTPAVLSEAAQAFAKNDLPTLNKYGRFLQPIAWRVLAGPNPPESSRVMTALAMVAKSHIPENACR